MVVIQLENVVEPVTIFRCLFPSDDRPRDVSARLERLRSTTAVLIWSFGYIKDVPVDRNQLPTVVGVELRQLKYGQDSHGAFVVRRKLHILGDSRIREQHGCLLSVPSRDLQHLFRHAHPLLQGWVLTLPLGCSPVLSLFVIRVFELGPLRIIYIMHVGRGLRLARLLQLSPTLPFCQRLLCLLHVLPQLQQWLVVWIRLQEVVANSESLWSPAKFV
mmetsp:Transcript_37063/g.96016  ORF Transcript_37063/g.96016 Transcript_37063/m.96016 type:complete len:217 (+) Transcript_37063:241-891(+)